MKILIATICIAVGIYGVYLLYSILPFKLNLNRMELFTLVLAIGTIFLAIASFCNIQTSKEMLSIMRDDSLMLNRPYIFLDSGGEWEVLEKEDETIKFTVNIKNSGKSAAKNLDVNIDKAIILENKNIGNEIKTIDIEEIPKEDIATIQSQPFDVVYSVYPQQTLKNVLPKIYLKDLQKRIFDDKKALFLEISISYYSLPFSEKQIEYSEKYKFVFTGEKDLEGKLQGYIWMPYTSSTSTWSDP